MEVFESPSNTIDRQFYGIVADLVFGGNDSEAGKQVQLNNWQKLAEATNDIVTPGNALDAFGFAGSVYGLQHLDSWKGIIVAAGSFMTDFFDGKVARATGTQSDLGEAIDAGGDKVKLALGLFYLWKLDLAPKSLLLAIAAQNAVNAGLTVADRALNESPVLHSSQFGKKAIFIQQWGLGLHVMGSQIEKGNENRGKAIKAAGSIIGYAGVGVGFVASSGYATKFINSRKAAKQS